MEPVDSVAGAGMGYAQCFLCIGDFSFADCAYGPELASGLVVPSGLRNHRVAGLAVYQVESHKNETSSFMERVSQIHSRCPALAGHICLYEDHTTIIG